MSKIVIKNGLLIDGNGGEAKKDQVVVVNGNKIEFVGDESEYQSSGDEKIVDADGGAI